MVSMQRICAFKLRLKLGKAHQRNVEVWLKMTKYKKVFSTAWIWIWMAKRPGVTSGAPKKQTEEFVFLSWQSENTWNLKLIFVSKSPDLLQIYCREKAQYPSENIDLFALLLLYTMESKYFYNIIETLFPSTMPLDIFTIYCNVCFIKIRSKHSNNTQLSLLQIFMKQTLP